MISDALLVTPVLVDGRVFVINNGLIELDENLDVGVFDAELVVSGQSQQWCAIFSTEVEVSRSDKAEDILLVVLMLYLVSLVDGSEDGIICPVALLVAP